jgi:hypothetical protein
VTGAEILALVPAVVGAFIAWLLVRQPRRRPNGLAVRPPVQGQQPRGGAGDSGAVPKTIPPAIRAELDDKPEFWTERFHQLLAAVAAPSVVEDIYEVVAYSGDTVLAWESRGYRDCPCHTCRRICRA